jgi:rhodanese-related sulfurtransferase
MTARIAAAEAKRRLSEPAEFAFLDVREEGRHSQGHPLFAVPVPLSRLEFLIRDLVPRYGTPIVLLDDGDGRSERAARKLADIGYADVAILDGGLPAWATAGFEVFSGVNVPSKAFGEFVEHAYATPSVSADELKAMVDGGRKLVILDSRPFDEFNNMCIPGGIDVPGAELVLRVHDLAPDPDTTVVVNCAGRTRSIIGAQSLINAGIPNRVVALRNGTMGWHLAGLSLERGSERQFPPASAVGRAKAKAAAERVGRRFGVRTVDRSTLDRWRRERDRRTLYLLDVRDPLDFEAGHIADFRNAPGGQLVQATDRYVATRGARLVLTDDDGTRATMTASWLVQMGWSEVFVVSGSLDGAALAIGPSTTEVPGLMVANPVLVQPDQLARELTSGDAAVLDFATSLRYRDGHVPGAWFVNRADLAPALAQIGGARRWLLTSPDGRLARLAAAEVAELVRSPVAVLDGGTEAWRRQGLALETGETRLASPTDDVWRRPYDHKDGVDAAMQAYLAWEVALVAQIERDGDARFRAFPT